MSLVELDLQVSLDDYSNEVLIVVKMGEFKLGLPGVDEGVDGLPGGDASNGQTKLLKSISFLLFLRFNVN